MYVKWWDSNTEKLYKQQHLNKAISRKQAVANFFEMSVTIQRLKCFKIYKTAHLIIVVVNILQATSSEEKVDCPKCEVSKCLISYKLQFVILSFPGY